MILSGRGLYMRYLFVTTVVLLLASGCGKKGPLIPPEAFIPAPVSDLRVIQKGENFLVSWSIPDRDEGGRELRNLAGFRLFRREVLPPDQDCEACSDAYRVVKDIDLEYLRDARRSGDRIFTSETGVMDGTTYQYKVVSYLKDGTPSRESNRFRLTKIHPLPGPRLRALSTPTSIALHWDPAALPPKFKTMGYNIYRWRANESPAAVPQNDSPLKTTDYEDLRLERGVTYLYCLRSVVDADGISVESVCSNEASGALKEPE